MYEFGIKPFKVGTKIKINKELPPSMMSSFGIAPEMMSYCEKIAIITKVILKYPYENKAKYYGYKIDIDNGSWLWGIDMFQEIKNILEIE